MALSFSMLASQLLVNRDAVLRAVCWPVLVWEAPPTEAVPGLAYGYGYDDSTESSRRPRRPTVAEPLLFEVRKRPANASLDVTLGRMPGNDIVIEDNTVSRTHACFRMEPHTGLWTITDAESHNGTFLGGVLIVPGRPMPLFDRAALRFGDVEVAFLQANAFEQYVRSRVPRSPTRLTRAG